MDINSLKLSEISDLERLGGRSVSSFADGEAPKGRMLQALVYVFQRRANPKYKFEDAGEVSMEEAMTILAIDDDNDDDADKSDA